MCLAMLSRGCNKHNFIPLPFSSNQNPLKLSCKCNATSSVPLQGEQLWCVGVCLLPLPFRKQWRLLLVLNLSLVKRSRAHGLLQLKALHSPQKGLSMGNLKMVPNVPDVTCSPGP